MHINNIIAMAYSVKLKLSGLDKGDVQLTKRQHMHATIATTVSTTTNPSTTTISDPITTTVTTITAKSMKEKISGNTEGEV